MKIVFLFSGQGSQYRGMGQKLFENNDTFRKSMIKSDLFVKSLINRSLISELYEVKDKDFTDLLITHPAIVAVELAMYSVLLEMGIKPDYVSGNSLGEYAAAVAGGIWDHETALEVAVEQAKSIIRNNISGGMTAVINSKRENLQQLYLKYQLTLASDNFPGHFTLSGLAENLDKFENELQKQEISFFRLPVAHPFHSAFMDEGMFSFSYYLSCLPPFSQSKPGFISGVACKEVTNIPSNYFWEATRNYTNFPELVKYLEQRGPNIYIDLGPSGTSATFVKYNLDKTSGSKTLQIMSPFKQEITQLELLKQIVSEKV